jgi:hypothetical protein
MAQKMSRPKILKPDETYTFSRYFELAFDPEDILSELDCTLTRTAFNLELSSTEVDISELARQIQDNLDYVDLTSETARREALIAPILLRICSIVKTKLKIEYPVVVNNYLRGNLDYFMQLENQLLVVEAKNADLTKGFTQLAVELIALDQWAQSESNILHGAVTTGDVWRFGRFDRQARQVQQDTALYTLPDSLETLVKILLKILSS